MRSSASAQELTGAGLADDVEVAVQVDESSVVPVLVDGAFRPSS